MRYAGADTVVNKREQSMCITCGYNHIVSVPCIASHIHNVLKPFDVPIILL